MFNLYKILFVKNIVQTKIHYGILLFFNNGCFFVIMNASFNCPGETLIIKYNFFSRIKYNLNYANKNSIYETLIIMKYLL